MGQPGPAELSLAQLTGANLNCDNLFLTIGYMDRCKLSKRRT